MQIKKEEIRTTILNAAQQEFLIHGYEGSSLRVIAKKANTTIGNIYHYFDNKEAILEELLKEPVEGLNKLIEQHFEKEQKVYSLKEVKEIFDQMDDVVSLVQGSEIQYLMDQRLLILLDLKTTRFLELKKSFIQQFKEHMAWHLGLMTVILPMWILSLKCLYPVSAMLFWNIQIQRKHRKNSFRFSGCSVRDLS